MLQYQKSGDASHLQDDVLILAVTGLRKEEKLLKSLTKISYAWKEDAAEKNSK